MDSFSCFGLIREKTRSGFSYVDGSMRYCIPFQGEAPASSMSNF
ncbi:hypothetical protein NOC27_2919 [Nitrosococcus oceani AFC27]|nr:hypothetical protein NOC27_2919 [Nitrosococcus oceani AFC27]